MHYIKIKTYSKSLKHFQGKLVDELKLYPIMNVNGTFSMFII